MLTAVVTGAGGSPTGTVSFFIDGVLRAGPTTLTPGAEGETASVVISGLSAGPHQITALYGGVAGFSSSTSFSVSLVILPTAITTTNVDGPQVVGVERFGYHQLPTTLVVEFNGPLDAASAVDADDYAIVGPGGQRVPVASATYDPATDSVTLRPSRQRTRSRSGQAVS